MCEHGKPKRCETHVKVALARLQINKVRWGQSMKSFNGAQQSWLREGEYLIGPQPAPQPQ